jgi:hypothetical protein
MLNRLSERAVNRRYRTRVSGGKNDVTRLLDKLFGTWSCRYPRYYNLEAGTDLITILPILKIERFFYIVTTRYHIAHLSPVQLGRVSLTDS